MPRKGRLICVCRSEGRLTMIGPARIGHSANRLQDPAISPRASVAARRSRGQGSRRACSYPAEWQGHL
eukprot:3596664-Pyramimonas_sp.AAC.1